MEATICLVHGPKDCSRLIHNGDLVEYAKAEEMCHLCRQAVKRQIDTKRTCPAKNNRKTLTKPSCEVLLSCVMKNIVLIERKMWKKSQSWGDQFEQIVSKPNTFVFAALVHTKQNRLAVSGKDNYTPDSQVAVVAGYAIVAVNSLMSHLSKIFVVPEYRRQNIGTKLVHHVVQFSKSRPGVDTVMLYVESKNAVAQALYLNNGFVKEDELQDYYSVGSHAYRMRCQL